MTNHSPTCAADAATPHELSERVAALELFMQQLVFVLEGHGAIKTDALTRWICLASSRMLATGSVPPAQVAALTRLQLLVQQ